MKTIWVIEQGCYSDYRVVGVFSSRENAELAMSKMGTGFDAPTIEEWHLDPCITEMRQGYSQWILEMLRDGTVESVRPRSVHSFHVEPHIWKRSTAPAYKGKNIPDCLQWEGWAKNAKHAVKIANEVRTQWIATGGWA